VDVLIECCCRRRVQLHCDIFFSDLRHSLTCSGLQGNERWVEALPSRFHEEFSSAQSEPWVSPRTGVTFGEVRSAGGSGYTAGNLTFVTIYEAG
jgi:hypothetical protein